MNQPRWRPTATLSCLLLFAFQAHAQKAGVAWQGRVGPTLAYDYDPRADVFETMLVARPGRQALVGDEQTEVWTYNGGTPGPTIELNVGDLLVVHFYNRLPEPTTVHWHGQELPAVMDGSHISQPAVPPGGTFRYEFRVLRAGLFWYHPHVGTNEQIEKGLYGALLVRDPEEDQALGLPEEDHVLILDDVLLDDRFQIEPPFPADPVQNALVQVNGRDGNHLLVNGRRAPTARFRRGQPQRLRIVNASNSRFMRLSIPGHRMWRIGGDGGLLEQPLPVEPIDMLVVARRPDTRMSNPDVNRGILLTPAERADVIFIPQGDGPVDLEWHDWRRGRHLGLVDEDGKITFDHVHMDGKFAPEKLMTLEFFGPPVEAAYEPPARLRTIEPIDTGDARTVPIMFGHAFPDQQGDVVLFAQMKDGKPLPFDMVSAADAPTFRVGETIIWQITNMTMGDHNFHTHGFHFQLIETEYRDVDYPWNDRIDKAPYREWKDTIRIPARTGERLKSETIVRLAARLSDRGREGKILAGGKLPAANRSGGWLFHCHILEHAARGMMSFFQIEETP